jgi:putative ABC transport system substrate-binding protein
MMWRVLGSACLALLIPASSGAAAQDAKTAHVGLLVVAERPKLVRAFRDGLRERGYAEGRNIVIEFRSAGGNTKRLPELARELVSLHVDAIVTHSTRSVRIVKRATSTIPIVMASVGNAVKAGLVASVARPGGNVTGNTFFGAEMAVKRIEVLKETLPAMKRMALLAHPSYPKDSLKIAESAIRSLGMEAQVHFADGPAAFDHAFEAMRRGRADGLQILASSIFYANRSALIEQAARRGMPTIYPWRAAPESGGLISYGPNLEALFRRAAYFVDKILKGANPATLPVEQPTQFELTVNLKTAAKLGLTMPRSLMLRADGVIE